jgi:hypothetical protein
MVAASFPFFWETVMARSRRMWTTLRAAARMGWLTGDFNGDGKLDLAVSDASANMVSILLGNGDGTFQAHYDYRAAAMPYGLATGDFNGDGHLDLAVVNDASNTVSVLLGNGDGTF